MYAYKYIYLYVYGTCTQAKVQIHVHICLYYGHTEYSRVWDLREGVLLIQNPRPPSISVDESCGGVADFSLNSQ